MKNLKTDKLSLCFQQSGLPGLLPSLSFLILTIFFAACYEPVEGCLDLNAINFGLDADRECDDCCDYPKLSIRFVHRWTDEDTTFTFNYTSQAFRDGGGHAFAIDRITYYLKDFALVRPGGDLIYTSDTVLVQKFNNIGGTDLQYIRDDYLLVNPAGTASLEVGTLRQNGSFNQLRFQLGIDAGTDLILPASLPDNHPLSFLDSSMYSLTDGRYLSNRLDLQKDTSANAGSLFLNYGSERAPVPLVIDLPAGFTLDPGFNVQIILEVNYAEWFQSVQSIANEPEATLVSEIVAEMSNSFKLLEISLSR